MATAEQARDMSPVAALEPRGRAHAWRSLLMALGGAAAFAIVWQHPDRTTDVWWAWAAFGTMLGVLSGASFGSGFARCRDVAAVEPVRWRRAVPTVLLMAGVAIAALVLATVIVRQGVIWNGLAIAGLAIVGAVPTAMAVVGVRLIAIGGLTGTLGRRLAGLLRLRGLLSRLNTVFGSLVVVLTLFTAAQRSLTTGDEVPASLVIYTGAAGAIVVAFVYLPTASLLRRRCARFIDDELPLDDVDRASLVRAAEDRHRLEAILGLHRTSLAELQNGLVIVAPLLASTGIALLPGF